jgi:FkbM family methyltransferase
MNPRQLAKIALANVTPLQVYLWFNARAAAMEIASRRRWEPEIEYLPGFVSAGDSVVDVGANHGLYSYHLSRLVGAAGQVHAFEPVPLNLKILSYTIERHRLRNVVVHPCACGDKPETATFCVPLQHGVPFLWIARQGSDGLTFSCEVVRLDDVITGNVSLLKIDVEGAELFVLRGAQRILRDCQPALLIEALGETRNYGYLQQDVFDFLASMGYRFFIGSGEGQELQRRERFTEARNYFCIPAEAN